MPSECTSGAKDINTAAQAKRPQSAQYKLSIKVKPNKGSVKPDKFRAIYIGDVASSNIAAQADGIFNKQALLYVSQSVAVAKATLNNLIPVKPQ